MPRSSGVVAFVVLLCTIVGVAVPTVLTGRSFLSASPSAASLPLTEVVSPSTTPTSGSQRTIASPTATPSRLLLTPTVTTRPSPTSLPVATPIAASATPLAIAYVGGTRGLGVHLRSAPRLDAPGSSLPDGTTVVLLGGRSSSDNETWLNVSDPAGNVGWVVARYLLPVPETPVPAIRPLGTGSPSPNLSRSPTPATATRTPAASPSAGTVSP